MLSRIVCTLIVSEPPSTVVDDEVVDSMGLASAEGGPVGSVVERRPTSAEIVESSLVSKRGRAGGATCCAVLSVEPLGGFAAASGGVP